LGDGGLIPSPRVRGRDQDTSKDRDEADDQDGFIDELTGRNATVANVWF